ncbi:bifunctional DNA-binding transcriptional regulator/O6-methylguanine-DNA methyltransferase Ada [Pseudomonas sp. JZ134]|uniref:bifunctional DNA-binding transcriptional regulator/O6-methylguanine-DNA methyltransferase Ada n=1 Tax=Pseudomonas sp. JZ134 TaxID=2806615 RepID=UPI003DA12658
MLDIDLCWNAVCTRDTAHDGRFVFAVQTTGIYCRPSCPARRPRQERVTFYTTPREAEAAGYRACKRCQPDRESPVKQQDALIQAACALLDQAEQPLSLDQLASRIGLSPSHLARLFKQRTGLTPRAWAEARRQQRLQANLPRADTVLEAALASGYGSSRAVYEQPNALALAQRRRKGAGEHIRYGIAVCSLGLVLVAKTSRGLCAVLFGDEASTLERELAERFAAAHCEHDDAALADELAHVHAQLDKPTQVHALPLDMQGSAFQQRVWQALMQIPPGETRRYGELAVELDSHPRAIARACASNTLGLLVPCHRVIGASGALTGYRWGVARKETLLKREAEMIETSKAPPRSI